MKSKPTTANTIGLSQERKHFLVWAADAPDDTLTTRQQATWFLNMDSERFLEEAARKGTGPAMVRISSRAIRYKLGDLRQWIVNRTVSHTQQEVPA